MSQFNDTGYGSITLTEAVAKHQRVVADGTLASATEQHLGFACEAGAIGDTIAITYANKQGTAKAIAAGAIAVGAKVHTAADGEVNDTQATGAFLCGLAVTAATADQDVIEIMLLTGDTAGS